jgi:protease-4
MSPAAVETLMGGGPYETEQSLALGLVDYVAGEPSFEDFLRRTFGESLEFEEKYGKEDGPDFGGGNPFAIFQSLMEDKTDQEVEEPSIALLYMTGGVVDGPPQEAAYEDAQISAYPLTRVLEELSKEENVKAVVIRVDSGGGSAMASDRIWEAVQRVRAVKPVVVSMGNVAASGGYYVAMGANYIFAEPMTITGSIGVIGGVPYMGELYDWVGLDFHSVTRGRKMNIFETAERLTQEERDTMLGLLEQTYEDFVGKAALGRNMTFEQIHEVAQGRVWSGRDAKRLGLIDETGGLFDAIDKAEELAGFDPAEDASLEIYPRKLSLADMLERAFGGFGASVAAGSPAMSSRAALMASFGPAIELLPDGIVDDALLLVHVLRGEGMAVMAPMTITIR